MYTIAIIDDDVYIGNMLEDLLNRNGYSVIRAYSGTEALLLLKGRQPDLILLDLMLPGLSGEAVLPEIQGIPVIVISAKIDIDNKVDVLMAGAADYLTKPFDTKELLARIAVQLRSQTADSRGQRFPHGPGIRNSGPPDQNRICDSEITDAKSRTGNHQISPAR